ncbi:hypothetical protein BCT74_15135 [Vibrio lentus]|uniref:Uncharacterized protein n=1 Tax=Vibrio lentus TaxID=136468 RepID=A0A2N7ILX5_9VIBR|nr:hypothetical protein BCT74_15135 [Vibrio lentus]
MWANYTSKPLPCINFPQSAAKISSKGQQPLIKVAIFWLKYRHYFMFVGKLSDKEGKTLSSHFTHFKLRQKI